MGDLDVHQNPELLDAYPVVVINGHSEYWSAEEFDAVDRYLCRGGNVVVLSGNSICWRVSYNPEGTIMECRKLNQFPGGRTGCTVGEIWHSQDGRRGSLARVRLPGLETGGTRQPGLLGCREQRAVPSQCGRPSSIPVSRAAGTRGGPGVRRRSGRRPAQSRRSRTGRAVEPAAGIDRGRPRGATLPEEPAGIVTLAEGIQPHAAAFDYFFRPVRLVDGVACHMIYWQRPQGGRVFHAGSVGAGWGLSVDPRFQTLFATCCPISVPRRPQDDQRLVKVPVGNKETSDEVSGKIRVLDLARGSGRPVVHGSDAAGNARVRQRMPTSNRSRPGSSGTARPSCRAIWRAIGPSGRRTWCGCLRMFRARGSRPAWSSTGRCSSDTNPSRR